MNQRDEYTQLIISPNFIPPIKCSYQVNQICQILFEYCLTKLTDSGIHPDMHRLQKAILELAKTREVAGMKLRELGEIIGEKHPQKIKHHREQLKKKGLLGQTGGRISVEQIENIKLNNRAMLAMPVLGSANCGEATLDATEALEGFLNVSASMVPRTKGLFAVRAVGLSMDKADIDGKNIEDGDYVVIDPNEKKPQNGEYVLSIINGAANIKKFIRDEKNQQVILVSESAQQLPPIYIHFRDNPDYFVNGTVTTVIKKPENFD